MQESYNKPYWSCCVGKCRLTKYYGGVSEEKINTRVVVVDCIRLYRCACNIN